MNEKKLLSRRNFLAGAVASVGAFVGAKVSWFPWKPVVWKMPDLSQLKPGSSFDLKPTLPKMQPGTFSVDPSGKALPKGISLSEDGILSVASDAGGVSAQGIIFAYTERS